MKIKLTRLSRTANVQRQRKLHFAAEKPKVNTDYYIFNLLPKLIEDCQNLKLDNFIFQQDGASAHAACFAQEWLAQNYTAFIKKGEWTPKLSRS